MKKAEKLQRSSLSDRGGKEARGGRGPERGKAERGGGGEGGPVCCVSGAS